jgi:hypothetical protein
MLSAGDLDSTATARLRTYLPRFREAPVPQPDLGDWRSWERLLASRLHAEDAPLGAMNIDRPDGFGTVCSQLLALPRFPGHSAEPRFLFAAGPPDREPFVEVDLEGTRT